MNSLRAASLAAVLGAVTFSAGCGGTGSSKPASAESKVQGNCHGTLGLEAAPLTRKIRAKLTLPENATGALVAGVAPGGPAAAAGIQVDDVVESVGGDRIASDCELIAAGWNRACEPVRVVVHRGTERFEVKVIPVDEDAFLEKACHEGAPGACFRKGWLLWSRDHDDARALEIFRSACQGGSSDACAFGGLQLSGKVGEAGKTSEKESPERDHEAVAMLQRSCELSSGAGCAHLAFLHATGRLVPKDDKRASDLYVRSCDLGDAQGCYNVGLMIDEGRGISKDLNRAGAAYAEACELGSSTACTNLGYLYEHGRGVPKDRPRAVELYQLGCRGSRCQPSNLGGCVNAGRAYRDGIGVEKSEPKAEEIFREACKRPANPDDIHSAENGARACSLQGALYLSGEGVALDLDRGRELSELGCGRGDTFGCFNAAAVYAAGSGVPKDPVRAAGFLEQACKGGDGEGCHDLAIAYEKGNGVAKDAKRAKALKQQACELGFSADCRKKKKA